MEMVNVFLPFLYILVGPACFFFSMSSADIVSSLGIPLSFNVASACFNCLKEHLSAISWMTSLDRSLSKNREIFSISAVGF